MPTANDIVFQCIEVRQPIGTYYVGAMEARDLILISYADMRKIKEGKARDIEEFSGIQRPLSPHRVAELKQYVRTVDASFPTSIILHIPSIHAEYTASGAMRVSRDRSIARIIDGQHRIAGLEDYSGPPFELNVTVFIDMDMEDQALLFATINLKQTKVNKSLAYDLYDFAQTRSPQKTSHNIARLLNAKPGSPFHHKIKILGAATKGRDETLTQATFIDRLLPYITEDAMKDRDLLKRGEPLPKTSPADQRRLIFREFFREDQDAHIAAVVWNYFAAVAARWPNPWNERTRGMVLNRTTGFAALMRFLRDAYLSISTPGDVTDEAAFRGIFDRMPLSAESFTAERYLPGTTGEAQLYRDLLAAAQLRATRVCPELS